MIYIVLALISLSVLYLTRYFTRKGMRTASVAIVALLCVVFTVSLGVLYVKAVHPYYPAEEEMFIIFSENGLVETLFGAKGAAPEFTMSVLRTVVALIAVTIGVTGLVLLHGFFEITRAVVALIRSSKPKIARTNVNQTETLVSFITQTPILKLICRMNC